ncbi:MAG: DUF4062 domain-containing protein, partial [Proteobacteria bacterium]
VQGNLDGIGDVASILSEVLGDLPDDRKTVRPLRRLMEERITGFQNALAAVKREREFASIRVINLAVLARDIHKLTVNLDHEVRSAQSGEVTKWATLLVNTCEAHIADGVFDLGAIEALRQRLIVIRDRARDIAFTMDFSFLFRHERRLLSIGFRVDSGELDESCYDEIENCHILILIIGGKYGSAASSETPMLKEKEQKEKLYQYYNSITQNEYIKAREKGIPIFIFVEKGVYAEYDTYKKNRDNTSIVYAHVDSINIFKLLDDIIIQRVNNFVRGFENFDDITNWLKDQWAGIFADFLSRKTADIKIKKLEEQIEELKELSSSLKVYNEAIMISSKVKGGKQIIEKEEGKLRLRKASRFRKERFITFLIRRTESKLTMNEVFNSFTETKTLEDFVLALGGKEEFFMGLNQRAQNEYLHLRNNYLDENNEVEDIENNADSDTSNENGSLTT